MLVRRAAPSDAADAARLLHDFNTEFDSPTPGAEALQTRIIELLEEGQTTILLAGDGPDGIAVLRFRRGLFERGDLVYLEELYVAPAKRGHGLGRALMEAVIEVARERGVERIELGTEETDTAARGLYESLGFTNREGDALMFFYELELS